MPSPTLSNPLPGVLEGRQGRKRDKREEESRNKDSPLGSVCLKIPQNQSQECCGEKKGEEEQNPGKPGRRKWPQDVSISEILNLIPQVPVMGDGATRRVWEKLESSSVAQQLYGSPLLLASKTHSCFFLVCFFVLCVFKILFI